MAVRDAAQQVVVQGVQLRTGAEARVLAQRQRHPPLGLVLADGVVKVLQPVLVARKQKGLLGRRRFGQVFGQGGDHGGEVERGQLLKVLLAQPGLKVFYDPTDNMADAGDGHRLVGGGEARVGRVQALASKHFGDGQGQRTLAELSLVATEEMQRHVIRVVDARKFGHYEQLRFGGVHRASHLSQIIA